MVDLTTRIGTLELRNPIMPGSGTFAEGLDEVVDLNRLGAFVTKSATPGLRSGNPVPRVAETPAGMLNSIGLPSKGVDDFLANILPFYSRFSPPLVASVSADTIAQFEQMAAAVSVPGVAAIEANISCPNIEEDGRAFAMQPDVTERVIGRMRGATDRPLWAKLTPNTGDIAEVARAAEAGGADAVVVANTILGIAIDAETRRPLLGSVTGGLSGPAVRPIILRMVYQCARSISIPIIASGGIETATHVVEFMLAGATAAQVGTASFIHPSAMTNVIDGLVDYCERHGIDRIGELVGAMEHTETDPVLLTPIGS
jgi:dihydroorotate dehydrogenase (NAD+) catalytic subunit